MKRTRKVATGLAAAAVLVAGGMAIAAPALAQTDPEPSGGQCPYECPLDRDPIREQTRERMHEQLRDQVRDQVRDPADYGPSESHGYGPGDGTCRLTPDPTE